MRVAANLAFVVPGAVGGSEEYSVRLLRALADHQDDDVEVTVVGAKNFFTSHPKLDCHAALPFRGPAHRRPYRVVIESTWVTHATRDFDLVHHFGGRIPARRPGCPTVVTVHDIQPLDMPENFSALKQRYLASALPRTVLGADVVVTPSAWVRRQIIDRFGCAPDRVRVVSSTSDPGVIHGTVHPVVASLGDRPLIIYPAVSHPHKNHRVLLDVLPALIDAHPDVLVVFTGGAGRYATPLEAAIRALDPEGQHIRHLGRVEAATLAELTARADVMAFPSRYEGFGLPVLEAMHRGTPVVAASTTALPEGLGNAGVLVDPGDIEGWAAALSGLLGDEMRRAELAVAGTARAEAYSPASSAAALLSVWRDAVS